MATFGFTKIASDGSGGFDMSEAGNLKIVIRHISGSKANQTEELVLEGRSEIRLGRDPASNIVYAAAGDDVVSRNHAAIRWASKEPLAFTLEDLGSSNGTFLNKQRVQGKSDLLPDDVVMFGKNGPSFIFDIDPRPTGLASRTRVIDAVLPAATRVLTAAEASTLAATAIGISAGSGATTRVTAPNETSGQIGKIGIGRETMLHEIARDRGATNRKWFTALAGLAGIALIGGGALYWKQIKSDRAQRETLQLARQEAEDQNAEAAASLKRQFGMSPQDIVRQYGPASARLEVQWRLYDQTTGRPIFLKTFEDKENKNKVYPGYVRLQNGSIVPWLTLDDEGRENIPIDGNIAGTAFVVSEKGFLLTSKHLASAWKIPFFDTPKMDRKRDGVLVEATGKSRSPYKYSVINIDEAAYSDLRKWVPEAGGAIFEATNVRVIGPGNIPDPRKNEQRSFVGRNDNLTVTFAGNRLGINSTLVRSSNESDAALIKIDSPQALHKVDIAENDPPQAGERVVVLGFPAIGADTLAVSETIENGIVKANTNLVPQPYVTEGIVALVSKKVSEKDGIKMVGLEGNIMQLTINSTGAGNSGGPVFNSSGKVIGLFTSGYQSGGANSTGAVPIEYGAELFKSQ